MKSGIQNSVEASPVFIEQVYQRLLELISLGQMKPGERVRQSELAERLGVSRQPISHALQVLKHQGLVREAGKQGVEVAPIDPDYVVHLYEARTSLEAQAAVLAASRVRAGVASAGQMQAVGDALARGQATSAGEVPLSRADVPLSALGRVDLTLSTLVRADYEFHATLYRLSGNLVIEQMMSGQWPHLMRSMMAVLDDPGVPARAWEEHAAIAQSVLAGDAAAAGERSMRHMDRAGADLHRRLGQRDQRVRESA